jgi:putative autoinducer-2 (AI-2) aldolase
MAGGPKCKNELEVFNFVHDGIEKGAIGINLGRNVWQHPYPVAMMRALHAVVHKKATPEAARDLFEEIKSKSEPKECK